MSDAWLRCMITPGQFSCEYSIEGTAFNGEGFSLFACDYDLKFPQNSVVATGRPLSGWIRVKIAKSDKSRALVQLPNSTMENGDMVTVNCSNLEASADCMELSR